LRVGEVLLADQDERALGHAPGVDVAFRGGDLAEGPAEVHGSRAGGVWVGPGNAALDRELDLGRPRAVAITAVPAGATSRQAGTEDVRHRARGQVEDGHVGRRQIGRRQDPDPGLDLAAKVGK
jgi:hypothetical protein